VLRFRPRECLCKTFGEADLRLPSKQLSGFARIEETLLLLARAARREDDLRAAASCFLEQACKVDHRRTDPGPDIERSRIDALGITLRDIERGLIDFPALASGRQVWLCWQLGEDTVAFWHELETGFGSRRPLIELS